MPKSKIKIIPTPRNWRKLTPHALAELTEFGAGIDMAGLAANMRENGYDERERIVMYEDKILDGRHRHAGAIAADVLPTFAKFIGDDPVAYVAKKAFRQHLNESQRAMLAAKLSTAQSGRPKKCANLHSKSSAAESLNVSRRSVIDAAKVQANGTAELNRAVSNGTISVSDAASIADVPALLQAQALAAVRDGRAKTAKAALATCRPMLDAFRGAAPGAWHGFIDRDDDGYVAEVFESEEHRGYYRYGVSLESGGYLDYSRRPVIKTHVMERLAVLLNRTHGLALFDFSWTQVEPCDLALRDAMLRPLDDDEISASAARYAELLAS